MICYSVKILSSLLSFIHFSNDNISLSKKVYMLQKTNKELDIILIEYTRPEISNIMSCHVMREGGEELRIGRHDFNFMRGTNY